uniref:HMA domain-containing protein n=1 Tax=Aegilops tauschii subsp. strangulata TaxID=200361 RepID=A0A453KQ81_AEGTS
CQGPIYTANNSHLVHIKSPTISPLASFGEVVLSGRLCDQLIQEENRVWFGRSLGVFLTLYLAAFVERTNWIERMGVGGTLDYLSELLGGGGRRRSYKQKRKQFQTVELKVRMDCDGCELKVRNALSSMKGMHTHILPFNNSKNHGMMMSFQKNYAWPRKMLEN